ncbi:MAG: hypothetical protein DRR19_28305 [Candidatus Parabeggiatoa sp. nov. 1]|nr:MAG: hypothetical protein DRR19_28305 [Gammaproteobacteria bacterium]
MEYPRGLIRYTTENTLNGKPTHILRPRIFVYGGILLAIFIGVSIAISTRSLVQLDVIRDRNSLFRETGNGLIENVYRLRVMNIDNQPHVYDVTVTGIEGLQLSQDREIEVEPGSVMTLPVRLAADPQYLLKRSMTITFQLTARNNPALTITEEARFLGTLR